MMTLTPRQRECRTRERSGRGTAPDSCRVGYLFWAALAVAAGLLLFCHGCHGDEDTELFNAAQQKCPRPEAVGIWQIGSTFYLGTRISIG